MLGSLLASCSLLSCCTPLLCDSYGKWAHFAGPELIEDSPHCKSTYDRIFLTPSNLPGSSLVLCLICSCCTDDLALLCAALHTFEGFASLLHVGLTDGLCLAACLCPASKKPNLIHRPIQCSACWVQRFACSIQHSACLVQHSGRHSAV